jgi:hypothetical protein
MPRLVSLYFIAMFIGALVMAIGCALLLICALYKPLTDDFVRGLFGVALGVFIMSGAAKDLRPKHHRHN